jgi:hypothetical protein
MDQKLLDILLDRGCDEFAIERHYTRSEEERVKDVNGPFLVQFVETLMCGACHAITLNPVDLSEAKGISPYGDADEKRLGNI